MMGPALAYPPAMMKRATAAAYLDLSVPAFEREVAAGKLPAPVLLGGLHHWSRAAIDAAVARMTSNEPADWRARSPLYAAG